jgi:Protein of unknown function (DUF4054)
MITVTPAQFRTALPEFADTNVYPDSLLTEWLTLAPNFINEERWGNLATLGAELVAAHFIVLAKRDALNPGAIQGVQTGKSVADLSVSYDVHAFMNPLDGMWNLTSYGLRYAGLRKMFGAGGIQLI